ncbi:hypothetical protein IQ07DRAFT_603523 [Pyrenochaeta sp. DS3sAY3a]|nr:hypothetical protein IQ07DRAFT_603523 [Pyrenochaeta sp. DS3sAY3a]
MNPRRRAWRRQTEEAVLALEKQVKKTPRRLGQTRGRSNDKMEEEAECRGGLTLWVARGARRERDGGQQAPSPRQPPSLRTQPKRACALERKDTRHTPLPPGQGVQGRIVLLRGQKNNTYQVSRHANITCLHHAGRSPGPPASRTSNHGQRTARSPTGTVTTVLSTLCCCHRLPLPLLLLLVPSLDQVDAARGFSSMRALRGTERRLSTWHPGEPPLPPVAGRRHGHGRIASQQSSRDAPIAAQLWCQKQADMSLRLRRRRWPPDPLPSWPVSRRAISWTCVSNGEHASLAHAIYYYLWLGSTPVKLFRVP